MGFAGNGVAPNGFIPALLAPMTALSLIITPGKMLPIKSRYNFQYINNGSADVLTGRPGALPNYNRYRIQPGTMYIEEAAISKMNGISVLSHRNDQ